MQTLQEIPMPITKEELIARSLLQANQMTGGALTVPSMMDNSQFNKLDVLERAEIIKQYADLSANHPATKITPSLGTTIASGARVGFLHSVLPMLTTGLVTVPTVAALTKSFGNPTAMMDIAKRVSLPLAAGVGVGMASGIVASLMGRAQAGENNAYLQHILQGIRSEQDPDEKRVKAMALVAATPTLNRRANMFDSYSHNLTQQLIGNFINPSATETFENALPQGAVVMPDGSHRVFNYNDWRYVEGLPHLTTEKGNPRFKIVRNEQ